MPGRSGSEVPPGAGPSRFERLLPFRLIAVADALQAEAPPSSAKDAFLDAWSVAEGLQPGAIATAARHHGLAMWLSTAEILFRSGVFKRYPRAHPARHLRDFSVLVVGWAAEAVPGVSGYVDLSAGRAVVPLLNGRLLLVSRGLGLAQRLRWTRTHGALLIGRDGGPVVAHIDCEEPSASRVSAPDWRIVLQEDRAGILLQGRVPDGEDSASGGTDGVELAEHAGRLLDDLRAAPRQLVTAVCRCLTYDPWRAGPEWVAGLVRLTCTDDARSLLEAAARDWVQRLLMLADVGQEFPPMDPALRSRFAALAGQTLATNLIGESRSSPRADRPGKRSCSRCWRNRSGRVCSTYWSTAAARTSCQLRPVVLPDQAPSLLRSFRVFCRRSHACANRAMEPCRAWTIGRRSTLCWIVRSLISGQCIRRFVTASPAGR